MPTYMTVEWFVVFGILFVFALIFCGVMFYFFSNKGDKRSTFRNASLLLDSIKEVSNAPKRYLTMVDLPAIGAIGDFYLVESTMRVYAWTGSSYVPVVSDQTLENETPKSH